MCEVCLRWVKDKHKIFWVLDIHHCSHVDGRIRFSCRLQSDITRTENSYIFYVAKQTPKISRVFYLL
jgi:hypothetical protein